jgi:hypothetical protein
MGQMGQLQKECLDCGWRGRADELDESREESGGKKHIFCPDCGGVDIEDLSPDEMDETPES